jgi:hypothetical protein
MNEQEIKELEKFGAYSGGEFVLDDDLDFNIDSNDKIIIVGSSDRTASTADPKLIEMFGGYDPVCNFTSGEESDVVYDGEDIDDTIYISEDIDENEKYESEQENEKDESEQENEKDESEQENEKDESENDNNNKSDDEDISGGVDKIKIDEDEENIGIMKFFN